MSFGSLIYHPASTVPWCWRVLSLYFRLISRLGSSCHLLLISSTTTRSCPLGLFLGLTQCPFSVFLPYIFLSFNSSASKVASLNHISDIIVNQVIPLFRCSLIYQDCADSTVMCSKLCSPLYCEFEQQLAHFNSV